MSLPWFFSCNIIQAHIRSNSSRSFFYNLPLRFPNSLCINFLLTSEALFLRALSRGVSIYLNLYTNNPFCRFCSQRHVFIKEMLQHFLICFATQILLYCISYIFWCFSAQDIYMYTWFFPKYELDMGIEMMLFHVLLWLERNSLINPWVMLLSVSQTDKEEQRNLLSAPVMSRPPLSQRCRHAVSLILPPAMRAKRAFWEAATIHSTFLFMWAITTWSKSFSVTPKIKWCHMAAPWNAEGSACGCAMDVLKNYTCVKMQPRG